MAPERPRLRESFDPRELVAAERHLSSGIPDEGTDGKDRQVDHDEARQSASPPGSAGWRVPWPLVAAGIVVLLIAGIGYAAARPGGPGGPIPTAAGATASSLVTTSPSTGASSSDVVSPIRVYQGTLTRISEAGRPSTSEGVEVVVTCGPDACRMQFLGKDFTVGSGVGAFSGLIPGRGTLCDAGTAGYAAPQRYEITLTDSSARMVVTVDRLEVTCPRGTSVQLAETTAFTGTRRS